MACGKKNVDKSAKDAPATKDAKVDASKDKKGKKN